MTITFLKPVVKVIAHTEFHGVPDDLMPMDRARQGVRLAAVSTGTESAIANDPELETALTRAAARTVIQDERGQDQGTTGERLIECAGRACYDSYGVGRCSSEYHKHIMEVDHGSVTEHAWLTFFLGNLSRGLTHELVRHRVGVAISQRSTRYVDENESPWVWHPLIAAYVEQTGDRVYRAPNGEPTDLSVVQRIGHVQSTAQREYKRLVPVLQTWLEGKGIDKFTARKQARGAARGLLGNALLTEMVWSCNVRTLRGAILKQRANAAADAEIRAAAVRLWEEALPYYPSYLGDFRRRPSPDGLSDELYLPDSPAEQLRVARARIRELEAQVAAASAIDTRHQ